MNIAVIIGLGVLGYMLLQGQQVVRMVDALVIKFRRLRNVRLDGLSLKGEVVLALNNPTTSQMDIRAITGRIEYGGGVLSTVNSTKSFTLARLAETEIVIPLEVSLLNALPLAKDYVAGSLRSADLKLLVTVGVQQIPFEYSVPLASYLPPLSEAARIALGAVNLFGKNK